MKTLHQLWKQRIRETQPQNMRIVEFMEMEKQTKKLVDELSCPQEQEPMGICPRPNNQCSQCPYEVLK